MVDPIPPAPYCKKCRSTGHYLYSSSATWRPAQVALCVMTEDVCDKCWGSKDSKNPGPDLLDAYMQEQSK